MASSPRDPSRGAGDSGFATAAATMISLALALVATALVGAGVAELARARSDLVRDQIDYALDGAQQQAVLKLVLERIATRQRFSAETAAGRADVLIEPEAQKLALSAAANLDDGVLDRLEVADRAKLRQTLAGMKPNEALGPALESTDPSPLWRACARSLISTFGVADRPPSLRILPPSPAVSLGGVGDVWRLRASMKGWTDERLVRLGGDRLHPAAILARRLVREQDRGERCDGLFAG